MNENTISHDKDDDIKQQNQRLRTEIDHLRARTQYYRTELNRYRDFRYTLKRGIKICLSEAHQKLRKIKRSLLKNRIRIASETSNQSDSKYNLSFKPYESKILYPLQNNRPRIVHALGNFFTGGSSRLVVDLFEHLGHQYEQEIIVKSKPYFPSYTGLKVYDYPHITNPHKILSYLRQFRPDIIHVHYWGECDWEWYDNVFQAAQEYGCKLIENINIPVEPYVSDSVDCYICVSDYVKRNFGCLDSRNITIYPGSNFNLFFKRDGLNPPDDCIGMVYRLDEDKLNERAIKVFIEVIQRRKGTKALIVGGGHYLETYQNAVQQAGVSEAFTFTNYVSYEELPRLYEQMSIFVAPVYKESFGQVSPFAMNMGIPVVGYNVGALEEIIGTRKLLAPPEDSTELAKIIIELLNDSEARHRIGEVNRQRAQQLFSVETMINSYRVLYEEMIQSSA